MLKEGPLISGQNFKKRKKIQEDMLSWHYKLNFFLLYSKFFKFSFQAKCVLQLVLRNQNAELENNYRLLLVAASSHKFND